MLGFLVIKDKIVPSQRIDAYNFGASLMTTEELLKFIENEIPTFRDLKLLQNGLSYHYTRHWQAIQTTGGFLGAPISRNLDQTQTALRSPPATDDNGVVFTYADKWDAIKEGSVVPKTELIEITYEDAVQATHSQEAKIGAPPSILILVPNIMDYRIVGRCANLKN